jgi:hypothetical protein
MKYRREGRENYGITKLTKLTEFFRGKAGEI